MQYLMLCSVHTRARRSKLSSIQTLLPPKSYKKTIYSNGHIIFYLNKYQEIKIIHLHKIVNTVYPTVLSNFHSLNSTVTKSGGQKRKYAKVIVENLPISLFPFSFWGMDQTLSLSLSLSLFFQLLSL